MRSNDSIEPRNFEKASGIKRVDYFFFSLLIAEAREEVRAGGKSERRRKKCPDFRGTFRRRRALEIVNLIRMVKLVFFFHRIL